MKFSRHHVATLHDLLASAIAFWLALYLRIGADVLLMPMRQTSLAFVLFMTTCGVSYYSFGLYRGVWRYASLHDATQILRATVCSILVFVALSFVAFRADAVPRSLPLILLFVLPCLLAGSRVFYRILREQRLLRLWPHRGEAVLLLGAGDEAELFIRTAGTRANAAFRILGMLDDRGGRVGGMIHHVKVLGHAADLEAVVTRLRDEGHDPHRIVLTRAPGAYPSTLLRSLIETSNRLDLPLARLPSMTELKASIAAGPALLAPIAIEDLLGRPEIHLDPAPLAKLVNGRRVLVTGAGGTIGSELCRQIAALGPAKLVLLEQGEFNLYTIEGELHAGQPGLPVHPLLCDVRDTDRVAAIFLAEQPELVFHAAAYKHVPMAEANVRETILTNVLGSRNVADAAAACGARAVVMISTDKVINPTSVMGATKRVAEAYGQLRDAESTGHHTRFMTVRFGNVLGSSGSVVPLFRRQLAQGGPLTVTHPDITRYFMTVREAVGLVLQATAHGLTPEKNNAAQRGKIFVLDMGAPVRIMDLARQMIRLAGLRPDADVKIEVTGLRPGEKLYEELFSADEGLVDSGLESMQLASPRVLDSAPFCAGLDILLSSARAMADDARLTTQLAALVPDFQPAQAANVIPLKANKL